MEIEDKILIMRGILGIVAGGISTIFYSSIYILAVIISFYVFSAVLSLFLFREKRARNVFGKGTGIYLSSWFVSLLLIYNLALR
ncbi:hypothetical protein [Saccharolobus shibatae]|uniref:Uncharacterized protein n=1 Tax=Saccharolobus shibatae TaxID=2286 RepID=A0A8F5BY09_9CREN|nr:hypothetical protein [Saccharolobus shibatae]QXJ30481.1 hypothetical protein J5U21_00121 [Saccharolobus shibatae]QXJ33528.1 hypothetical protein J5U22_00064 [Saccharolobus shibatae]